MVHPNSAPVKSASVMSTTEFPNPPLISARIAPQRLAFRRSAPVSSTPRRSARDRSASRRSAKERSAPARFASSNRTERNFRLRNAAPLRAGSNKGFSSRHCFQASTPESTIWYEATIDPPSSVLPGLKSVIETRWPAAHLHNYSVQASGITALKVAHYL